jgi:hypothetical protein
MIVPARVLRSDQSAPRSTPLTGSGARSASLIARDTRIAAKTGVARPDERLLGGRRVLLVEDLELALALGAA